LRQFRCDLPTASAPGANAWRADSSAAKRRIDGVDDDKEVDDER
jgi:hypothetical protein